MFHLVPISGLGKPKLYHDLGVFYKEVGDFDLGVYLVGVILLFLVVVW